AHNVVVAFGAPQRHALDHDETGVHAASLVQVERIAAHLSGDRSGLLTIAKKKTRTVTFPASLLGSPDATGHVTISGKVSRKGTVQVDVGANGSIDATVKADKKGSFTSTVQVGFGSTSITLTSKKG